MSHDPADASSPLVAPTEAEWRAMAPAERERLLERLVDALSDPVGAMTEGRRHKKANGRVIVYDRGRQQLHGYRLALPDARRYVRIVPQLGHYPSSRPTDPLNRRAPPPSAVR